QITIAAQHVVLAADLDMVIALRADALGPYRLRTGFAAIALEDRPRMGQGMVDHGYVVEKKVRVVLVDVDPFLDDGLIVVVQRNGACIERPRGPESHASRLPAHRICRRRRCRSIARSNSR